MDRLIAHSSLTNQCHPQQKAALICSDKPAPPCGTLFHEGKGAQLRDETFGLWLLGSLGQCSWWTKGRHTALPPSMAQSVTTPMKDLLDLFAQILVTALCWACSCSGDCWLHTTWSCGVFLPRETELEAQQILNSMGWTSGHILPIECLTTLPPSREPSVPILRTKLPCPIEIKLCASVTGEWPGWDHSTTFPHSLGNLRGGG